MRKACTLTALPLYSYGVSSIRDLKLEAHAHARKIKKVLDHCQPNTESIFDDYYFTFFSKIFVTSHMEYRIFFKEYS